MEERTVRKRKRRTDSLEAKLLGRRLRELRRIAKISQDELGQRIGKDHSFVSRVERGVINLDFISLFQLIRAMGSEPATFLIETAALFDQYAQESGGATDG